MAIPNIDRVLEEASRVKRNRLANEFYGFNEQIRRRPPAPQWVWVLSGGGAKGAFQLGAAQALMCDIRFRPAGFATTSVGSVNVLALAEGDEAGVEKLTGVWLELRNRDDMYAWSDWTEQVDDVLSPHGLNAKRLLQGMMGGLTPGSLPSEDRLLRLDISRKILFDLMSTDPGAVITTFATGGWGPLALLHGVRSGTDALKTAVSKASRILIEKGDGLFTFEPLRARMKALDLPRLDGRNLPLRFVLVGAVDGLVYHVRQNGTLDVIMEDEAGRPQPRAIGDIVLSDRTEMIVESALASASIPIVNPPIRLRVFTDPGVSEAPFVDGGVREILPVDAGLAIVERDLRVAPSEIGMVAIAVSESYAQPGDILDEVKELRTVPRPAADRDPKILDVAGAAFSAILDEILTNERRQALTGLPAQMDRLTIFPAFPIGPATVLDPGLIQLQMAYGFMTAFDVKQARLAGC